MVDFSGLADKAKNLVAEHSEQVKSGVEKVGELAGNKFGHDKVNPIEEKIGAFVDKLAGEQDPQVTPAQPVTQVPPVTAVPPVNPPVTPAPPVVAPPAAPPVTPAV